jgi:hypothetical protein
MIVNTGFYFCKILYWYLFLVLMLIYRGYAYIYRVFFHAAFRNRNQNRRKRNLLTNGTEAVTCYKVGTGTVINYGSGTGSGTVIKWNHKSSHRHSLKLCI